MTELLADAHMTIEGVISGLFMFGAVTLVLIESNRRG